MFGRMPLGFLPAFVLAIVAGPLAQELRASGILYNVTDLGGNRAVALNDAGQVALNQWNESNPDLSSQSNGTIHALLYSSYGPNAGEMTFVGRILPGGANQATNDIAMGLMASGQVQVNTATGAYLTDGKTYQSTGSLPIYDPRFIDGLTVLVGGVNAAGMIVGYGNSGVYLIDGTKRIDLNSAIGDQLGITLNVAVAINGTGQILAEGHVGSNPGEEAFLLTPVGVPIPATPAPTPEPGTLAILGLALGASWLGRRALGTRNR